MKALGEPSLVPQMGRGRSPWPPTEQPILAFTIEYGWAACGERGFLPGAPSPESFESNKKMQTYDGTIDEAKNEPINPLPAATARSGPHGVVSERDLNVAKGWALLPYGLAKRAPYATGESRRVDPRADRLEPFRGRSGRSMREGWGRGWSG